MTRGARRTSVSEGLRAWCLPVACLDQSGCARIAVCCVHAMGQCDLLTVYTRIGGGHKAAALALCEAARDAGLSTESRDVFDLGPRVVGDAILGWHLRSTAHTP